MDKFTKNMENMTTTTQDHYSLRWNNHQNHILRAFDTLLQTKALVDVTLVCAEISIQAHKIVLSACSPFFQRVFAETPCKHPVIVLKDFRGWVVQAIVDFMYRGEISVPQERLQTLIQAGESLQVRGLVENNVPENNPTPAASPDDFGMLDTSLLSSEYGRCSSSFDEECPTMVNNNGAKIMLSQHMFSAAAMAVAASASASTSITSTATDNNRETSTQLSGSRSELCTSPMPRRKQARPRRRSGECPPPDLNSSSKPNTPVPQNKPTNGEHLEEDNDYEEEEEEEEEMNEEIQDVEDHVEAIKIEVDKNRDRDLVNNTETEKSISDNVNSSSENDENANIMNTNETEKNDDDQNQDETGLNLNKRQNNSMSEGPENLCTKKQKVDDEINNQNNHDDEEVKCTDPDDKEEKEQKQKEDNANNNNAPINNNRIVLSLKDIRHLNKQPTISCRSPNPFQPPPHELLRPPSLHRDPHSRDHSRDNMKNDSLDISRNPMDSMPDHDSPLHFDHMDLSMAAAAAAAAHHQNQMNVNSLLGPGGPHHHPPPPPPPHHHHRGQLERLEESLANRLNKEFTPSSPMSLPPHFNPDGPPHPPSPLPFPGMSSALALTPPHMFGLDSPLGLFPPGMDPGKLYNPLMDMTDPRGLPGDHPPFMKKKMPRPKGQHSAPRGGPPRSWTNAELTEALQHVWNKKMTTSQASRIFGIPYNSLLMYVRGKYGKSLKLEQLRKDCISGPPIELLQMGINSGGNNGSGGSNNNNGNSSSKNNNNKNHNLNDSRAKELSDLENSIQRSLQNEADLLQGNPLFNPFPPGFYPDFPGGFPGLPLSMLNLLPPERHPPSSASSSSSAAAAAAAAAAALHLNMDEDCKSDRSKQSLEDDFPQPLALNRDIDRRELLMQPNGQD